MVFNILDKCNIQGKKKEKKIKLLADDAYDILSRISNENCNLLGLDEKYCRPEWLICKNLLIPPPCIRPSVKHDTNLRSEDDLTYKLLDIIKANNIVIPVFRVITSPKYK